MRGRSTRGAIAALALATLLAFAFAPRAASAAAGHPSVAVLVPAGGSRLTEELRQELEASGFPVLNVPGSTFADGRAAADLLLGSGAAQDAAAPARANVVAVIALEPGLVRLYARGSAPRGPQEITLPLGADDRPARRRVCLAVVEQLRQLENAPPAPTADRAPITASPPLPPAPPPETAPTPGRPWTFGALSDLDVISARGTPTAHIALIAERPWRGPLSWVARAAWPVLGAQFLDEGRSVRTWTFSGEFGLGLHLRRKEADLRPVLAATVGLRAALSDTDEFELRTSRIVMTPAAALGASAALRYRLRPLIDLVLETGFSQGFLLLFERRDYERAAAEERVLRISLGVLFEY